MLAPSGFPFFLFPELLSCPYMVQSIHYNAMSASPPPTPPARAPDYEDRRFKNITLACEWIEDYHPGGYHPVHLGDVFNNGQYKVIRKLGDGSYSTVWLARDLMLVDPFIIPLATYSH
jgi:non-specific serine/threonine protein kinase